MPSIDNYIASILSSTPTPPAILDEGGLLDLLSRIMGKQFSLWNEITEDHMQDITVYDIPDDKKEFSIKIARELIDSIGLAPYSGKHIYILRHFDRSNLEAQNALLKILEDCPPYAVILLEADSTKMLLDTVLSRVMDFTNTTPQEVLSPEGQTIAELYRSGDRVVFLAELYRYKCTSAEAILLLRAIHPYTEGREMYACQDAIEILSATYENPRNILDTLFL